MSPHHIITWPCMHVYAEPTAKIKRSFFTVKEEGALRDQTRGLQWGEEGGARAARGRGWGGARAQRVRSGCLGIGGGHAR